MRVLIYGGRDFQPTTSSYYFLDHVFNYELADWEMEEITLVSGGARGADSYGEDYAASYGYTVDRFPADWNTHSKAAGHIRNQQMLDSGIDLAVEFPGGRGTADMRRRLDKAGVKVIEYKERDE